MNKIKCLRLIFSIILIGLVACTDSDDNQEEVIVPDIEIDLGPVEKTEFFTDGPNGNLWKPVSENNGNIVVLFNPSYRKVFEGGCSLELRDGTFSQMFCGFGGLNCFTNPNRLTMRSNVKCSNVKEVKVVCQDIDQIVTFTVPDDKVLQTCTRHD
jgi:hypothetical protein